MKYKTSEIAEAFQTFYSTLYTIRNNETQEQENIRKRKIKEYLKEVKLPMISQNDIDSLEAPITQDEIYRAFQETPGGKSPGPDGLPIKYYKKFKRTPGPRDV